MRIRVIFFAQARDLAGCTEVTEELKPGTTVRALLEIVLTRFPGLKPLQKSLRVAVGVDYQSEDHVLQDGDEVALLPPMQGG